MSVKLHGFRELDRDLGKFDKAAHKELRLVLRVLAEPVAVDTRRRAQAAGWSPKTVSGIRAGSRMGKAVVRQSRRKTTGDQPGFGAQQMTRAFIPALEQNEAKVVVGVERMLDGLIRTHRL